MTGNSTPITQDYVIVSDTEPQRTVAGLLWRDTSGSNVELQQWTGNQWETWFARGPDTPTYPADGTLWNPGDGTTQRYDGGEFLPVATSPITEQDGTDTFDGSNGETVTSTGAEVKSDSVVLDLATGTTATADPDDSTTTKINSRGLEITPNTDISGVDVTLSSNQGTVDTVFLGQADSLIDEITGSFSSGDTVRLNGSLSSGTSYVVGVFNSGSSYTVGEDSSPSFPYTSGDIDITSGAVNNHPDDSTSGQASASTRRSFISVSAVTQPTSATAYVEWPQPDDVFAWGKAAYTVAEDGETATVDVQTNDGSGWTTIATDINRGTDLSALGASAGDKVRFKVNLSRETTSNNPRLESIYRRYEV